MDRIQEMQFFIAVAQAGSFSAAARETGASLSSIWRHVNGLEERVGAPLLQRTNKQVVLTESGKRFLDQAREVVRQINEMDEALSGNKSDPRGKLLLHCHVAMALRFVGPALPDFLEKYPDVTVNLWASDGNPDIVDNSIDLALRVGSPVEASSLVARSIGQVTFRLCASPGYLATRPPIKTPQDLEAHDCLSYRFGNAPPVWHLIGPGGQHNVSIRSRLQSSMADPLRQAAIRGMGVTLLPARVIREDIAEGRLVPLLSEYVPSVRGTDTGVYLVWRKDGHLPAKMRVMIDFLVDLFDVYAAQEAKLNKKAAHKGG